MMAATLAEGQDRARQRRARARDHRSRRVPHRDGRRDRAASAPTASPSAASTRLHGAEHSVIPDRIETGTYAMAAAITGGDVELVGARTRSRRRGGAHSRRRRRRGQRDAGRASRVSRRNGALTGVDVMTEPFPGFPTDLQAQMMALMTTRRGRVDDHRDDLREPLHARARTVPHGRQHQRPRRLGDGARRAAADRRAGDGDRPARLGVAGARRARGRRRDHRQPRLSPRSRLRAARGEARRLRRRHRAADG